MELAHFSLCSGIGGIDLAAEWAGFKTIAQCEIDSYASRVLAKNFKEVFNYGDIRAITNDSLAAHGIRPGITTVLSAGFPCQPYSLAGKGAGASDSRDLWYEVARCIGVIKPKWFVGENTLGLLQRGNGKYFRRVCDSLAAMGYTITWGVWGACDEGAPHERKRVFIIAHTNGQRNKGHRVVQPNELLPNTFIPVGGTLPYTSSEQLGLHRGAQEIKTATSGWQNNRMGTHENASGQWWQAEPNVGRVANGVSARVDKLRCLGNAVVPMQVYPIFELIAEAEKLNEDYEKGLTPL